MSFNALPPLAIPSVTPYSYAGLSALSPLQSLFNSAALLFPLPSPLAHSSTMGDAFRGVTPELDFGDSTTSTASSSHGESGEDSGGTRQLDTPANSPAREDYFGPAPPALILAPQKFVQSYESVPQVQTWDLAAQQQQIAFLQFQHLALQQQQHMVPFVHAPLPPPPSFEIPTGTYYFVPHAAGPMPALMQRETSFEELPKGKGVGAEAGGKKGTKRFVCPHEGCGKSFARNFNCQSHYASHLGIRNFNCHHCPKKFSRRHDRARHCNAVHSRLPKCNSEEPQDDDT